jgi:methylmalonyl-CoA/ethylmalonyl-CoA epimerase
MEPLDPGGALGRFLAARGEGIHHLAFAVPDITAALTRARAAGLRVVDEDPRPGAGGTRVAFLHPSGTHGVLIELVEE